ncbi:lipocalin-like domain-containing protein [Rubrobacter indicoceani]|uniref:lipocalin-like domain-containing protein n=1 Tax=Rubrobacter indicoceani TaxID=2051957 RepID=UPI000E5A6F8E|nr:lipocalin-like domain-containing protein [Rubrobacter indicoceani]
MDTARFTGAWNLRSMRRFGADGEVSQPYGQNPVGIIMYTPDGYMSANIMRSGRPGFPSDAYGSASPEEQGEALRSYLAYAGPFEVASETKVIHHVTTSLIPNWTGGDQTRYYAFDDSRRALTLSTHPADDRSPGRVVLVWERAGV